jgi:nucleoside-diphosphate-sugar epimerase
MALHVIVGAGAIGSGTARLLADAGEKVRVVSRSGRAPDGGGVEGVAADAADPAALRRATDGAAVLYNCANPGRYSRWSAEWPPLAASLLATAEATGAVLVTMSNLYAYGPVDHPMTEADPLAAPGHKGRLRAAMWTEALAAHRAGRVRVTEARASDFFGPGAAGQAHLGDRVIPPLLAGKRARLLINPDTPHSWTYLPDIARTLVVLGSDQRALGRAWHVPTTPPLSAREVAKRLCQLTGSPPPRLMVLPAGLLRAARLVSAEAREIDEVLYQFDRPFVVDSTAFEITFGVRPTPMDEALLATAAWWRDRTSSAA